MLKHRFPNLFFRPHYPAAFRRLCVETINSLRRMNAIFQPPSGGCVLKHHQALWHEEIRRPAAFRRLCVETFFGVNVDVFHDPAAFRRLCVETAMSECFRPLEYPAAFRRLCVETEPAVQNRIAGFQPPSGGCVLKLLLVRPMTAVPASRLQAAVC